MLLMKTSHWQLARFCRSKVLVLIVGLKKLRSSHYVRLWAEVGNSAGTACTLVAHDLGSGRPLLRDYETLLYILIQGVGGFLGLGEVFWGARGGVAIYENLGFLVSKPGVSQSPTLEQWFLTAFCASFLRFLEETHLQGLGCRKGFRGAATKG